MRALGGLAQAAEFDREKKEFERGEIGTHGAAAWPARMRATVRRSIVTQATAQRDASRGETLHASPQLTKMARSKP
jgi:hypothetical protein